MQSLTARIFIARPPADVFAYISNFENNPRWQRGMVEARFTTEGPVRVGSRYEQKASFLGRSIISEFEVIEFDPGRLVKATTVSGSFPITFTRKVAPEGTGTAVSAEIEGDAAGFFKVVGPLLRPLAQRAVTKDYQRLKELLEVR